MLLESKYLVEIDMRIFSSQCLWKVVVIRNEFHRQTKYKYLQELIVDL